MRLAAYGIPVRELESRQASDVYFPLSRQHVHTVGISNYPRLAGGACCLPYSHRPPYLRDKWKIVCAASRVKLSLSNANIDNALSGGTHDYRLFCRRLLRAQVSLDGVRHVSTFNILRLSHSYDRESRYEAEIECDYTTKTEPVQRLSTILRQVRSQRNRANYSYELFSTLVRLEQKLAVQVLVFLGFFIHIRSKSRCGKCHSLAKIFCDGFATLCRVFDLRECVKISADLNHLNHR